jgi:hypothetical protein
MKTQMMVGYVVRFKPRQNELVGGFGTVIVPDLDDKELPISNKCGPFFVKQGKTAPEFIRERTLKAPLPTDELILEVSNLNGKREVLAYGYAVHWRKAESRIAAQTPVKVSVAMPKKQASERRFTQELKSFAGLSFSPSWMRA